MIENENQPGDDALVLKMKAGDLEALGVLYDRHRNPVFRTALAITGDRETAGDLLQDVFLRLYRFADRIDPTRPLEPWLYRMTANLAYTWVKRNQRWIQPLDDLADWLMGGGWNGPYDQAEKRDEWDQVQRAILALPLQQRVVVVLYYLNDLSLQEVADILDVPLGTVKSRLHYGRETLKKHLGIDLAPEGEKLTGLNYESR
jgi:RNA polymerase sigma-70 factor (ECF subfamily)